MGWNSGPMLGRERAAYKAAKLAERLKALVEISLDVGWSIVDTSTVTRFCQVMTELSIRYMHLDFKQDKNDNWATITSGPLHAKFQHPQAFATYVEALEAMRDEMRALGPSAVPGNFISGFFGQHLATMVAITSSQAHFQPTSISIPKLSDQHLN